VPNTSCNGESKADYSTRKDESYNEKKITYKRVHMLREVRDAVHVLRHEREDLSLVCEGCTIFVFGFRMRRRLGSRRIGKSDSCVVGNGDVLANECHREKYCGRLTDDPNPHDVR
jgi:hypothetical protein